MKPIALANSFAVMAFLSFLICVVWATIDQNSFVAFWNSWVHGFNLELIVPDGGLQKNIGQTIFGIVSFTISSWLAGYLIAWFYNRSEGKH